MSDPEQRIRVQVAYALPQRQWLVPLDVVAGTTAADAVEASGLPTRIPGFSACEHTLAVYSRPVASSYVLQAGDRLEILRPLLADPKQGRRERARRG